MQFVDQIKSLLYGIKKVYKFESNKRELCRAVDECIDDILSDVIMHDVFEYISIPHVLIDNQCLDVYIYFAAIITMKHLQIIFHQID